MLTSARVLIMRGATLFDLLLDAALSLLRRPVHTIAMMASIVLGLAGATAAVVLADTQQAQVDKRFDAQRSDTVVIKADSPSRAGFDSNQVAGLSRLEPVSSAGEFSTWSDSEQVERSFSGATEAGPREVPVLAADADGARASRTVLLSGAPLALLGQEGSRFVWVGVDLAKSLGLAQNSSGGGGESQLMVDGMPFSVAGIIDNNRGFGYVKTAVVLSRDSALAALGGSGSNVRVLVRVRPGSAQLVGQYAMRTLDLDNELSLRDVTPPDGQLLVADVGRDLRRFGFAIVAFMGVIGMVTVSNTLLLSVYQRQRELGLRSAIGWRREKIAFLIILESVLAGAVAGVLGCALGLLAAFVVCQIEVWDLVVPPGLAPTLITGGTAASMLGGLIPAWRAASVSPLTAMRA